jgi:choline dehydrogenase-like flavoprotein
MAVYLGGRLPADRRPPAPAPFGGPHSISVPRFRNLTPREGRPFTRGYGIWGHVGRGSFEQPYWMLTALLEVLSRDENRIELDDRVADAWDIRSARIHLRYGANEWAMSEDATQAMTELAEAAGLPVTYHYVSTPGYYVHELGGARMGMRRSNSVLNAWNQCWDAANVFVVDGAAFPSAGWQNPTLTMMALAGRASTHLIAERRRGHL